MKNTSNKSGDFIDIAPMLKEWGSKWYWFIISAIVFVGLAWGYTKIRKDKYQINANLLIAQDDTGLSAMSSLTSLFGSNGAVDDEIFVVASHSVLKEAVKDLQLQKSHLVRDGFLNTNFYYKEYPVEISTVPEIADTLRETLVFVMKVSKDGHVKIKARNDEGVIAKLEADSLPAVLKTDYGTFTFTKTDYFIPNKAFKTTLYYSGYDARAEEIAEDLNIEIAAKKSNVILMSMKTPVIPYGVDLLNKIIEHYNMRGVAETSLQGRQTAEFIDGRLKLIVQDLDTVESNVEAYKLSHGISDVWGEAQYQMARKGGLDQELIAAETKLEIIQMTRDFLHDSANAYNLIPSLSVGGESSKEKGSDPIEAYNELILERMKLVGAAKPNNVLLRQIDEQLDAMRGNIKATLERAYAQQSVAVKALTSQMAKTEQRLGSFPVQEREYRDIYRQQSVKEALYIFLLQKREETAMLIANTIPKGVIVDEAYALNKPLGMKRKAILAIALFLGLCFPPIFWYVKRLFRTKFQTREEVEQLTSIPMLGEVCTSRSTNPLVVRADGSSSAAELFRLIRANLQFLLNDKEDKVILLTSTISGEGKSFVAINLAASMAMLGKKVLLVGMDIRAPKLGEYLNVSTQWGLTQYLAAGNIALDEVIKKNAVAENMDLILSGPIPPNPAELLTLDSVDKLFSQLRQRYDYIIVDSAPVGMVSDTFTLTRIADATVYVCRANYTTFKDLEFVNGLYEQKRLNKMGLIVNGTTARKGYGYGYGHTVSGEHARK